MQAMLLSFAAFAGGAKAAKKFDLEGSIDKGGRMDWASGPAGPPAQNKSPAGPQIPQGNNKETWLPFTE
jgi:hypothetical protein